MQTGRIYRDLRVLRCLLGGSENDECLQNPGLGALLEALERSQAREIIDIATLWALPAAVLNLPFDFVFPPSWLVAPSEW